MVSVPSISQRQSLLNTLRDWLYIEDTVSLDVLYGVALSHYLPGEPVWLFLIAPPGGTKTELLRAFQGEPFYTISTLTPQTLISGLNKKGEVDLLPHLDGKVLVVKDFTSILSRESKEQAQIFADLRDAYDGYLEKAFGSGVGKKGYHAKFEVIAGVTPAIDMYRVIHGILGERFVKCRVYADEAKAIDKATEVMGKEEEMRSLLASAVSNCIAYYARRIQERAIPSCGSNVLWQIKALGNLTAKLRSEIARDRYHTVLYYPEAEIGTRLTKQLLKLAQAIAIFHEHDEIGDDEMVCLTRVARDSIPKQRYALLNCLAAQDGYSDTTSLGDESDLPTQTVREILEELWMLKLVDRRGTNTFEWRLNDKTRELVAQSRILKDELVQEDLNTQNPMYAHERHRE